MEEGKKENWEGNVENWKWKEEKLQNEEKTFLFFLCFSLFKTTKICFGSTTTEIFYREKIRKNDFAPSEKRPWYRCNAGTFASSWIRDRNVKQKQEWVIGGQIPGKHMFLKLIWNFQVTTMLKMWPYIQSQAYRVSRHSGKYTFL